MKKYLSTHQFLSSIPLIFFILFLHPLYGVRLFEENPVLLIFFKGMTLAVILAGIGGIGWYMYACMQNIRSQTTNKPGMWFMLPLNLVSFIIIWKFLIGVVLGAHS